MWHGCVRIFCASSAWLLLLLALLVTALRLLLPQTALWEPSLRQALADNLAGEVSYARLGLRLEGLSLRLSAKDVRIQGAIDLDLPRLDIQLDILASLKQGQINLRQLQLYGGKVFLEQTSDKIWKINGLSLQAEVSKKAASKARLQLLELRDWTLAFQQATGRRGEISGLSLRFEQQAQKWLLWQESGRQNAQLQLDNQGQRGQLRLEYWPLAQLPLPTALAELNGSLNANVSLFWQENNQQLQGTIKLNALTFAKRRLPDLAIPFHVTRMPSTSVVTLPQLMVFGETPWQTGQIQFTFQDLAQWQLSIDWLPKAFGQQVAAWFWPDSPWQWQSELYDFSLKRQKSQLEATGILENFSIRHPDVVFSGLSSQFSFRKNLQPQESAKEKEKVNEKNNEENEKGNEKNEKPEIAKEDDKENEKNEKNEWFGQLRLKSAAADLHWPEVFSEDKKLRLDGLLTWRYHDQKHWQIKSEALTLADSKTDMTLRLDLSQDGTPATVDGQLAFSGLSLPDIPDYLPRSLLGRQTLAWLKAALQSGRSEAVRLIFRGQLADFPFAKQQGRLEARFFLRQGTLNFAPNWPPLRQAEAELVFVNRGLAVAIAQAQLATLPFRNVTLQIKDLLKPVVELQLQAALPGNALLKFLRDTPALAKTFTFLPKNLTISGKPQLNLALTLPVAHTDDYRLNGSLRLAGQTLQLSPYTLENLQGLLTFSEKNATLQPSQLTFQQEKLSLAGHYDAQALQLTVQGGLPVAAFLEILEENTIISAENRQAIAQLLSGKLQGQLHLNRPTGKPMQWQGQSDLSGLAIHLPPPFAKSARTNRDWQLTFTGSAGNAGQVTLQTPEKHYSQVAWQRQPEKTLVRIGVGSGAPRLPEAKADISLAADLKAGALGLWLEATTQLLQAFRATASPSTAAPSFHGEIHVGDFQLENYDLGKVAFTLTHAAGASPLNIQVLGEQALGNISFHDNALTGRLQKLVLPKSDTIPDTLGAGDNTELPELPDLDLAIRHFSWSDRNLGNVQIIGKNHAQGFDIEKISLEVPGLKLNGSGVWLPHKEPPLTEIAVALTSDNLGLALTYLGLQGFKAQGQAEGNLLLRWPNHLVNFAWPGALAQGFIRGENLAFHDLDPGLGRLLGLLQLRLDSAFQEGLRVDRFSGAFRFLGNQWFIDPLQLDSNLANILLRGNGDIEQESLDLLVRVRPNYSSGLPFILTATSGAQAGVVALALHLLLGRQVENIGALQYRLFGTWQDLTSEWVEVLPAGIPMLP